MHASVYAHPFIQEYGNVNCCPFTADRSDVGGTKSACGCLEVRTFLGGVTLGMKYKVPASKSTINVRVDSYR
jgi:hypothetical protein